MKKNILIVLCVFILLSVPGCAPKKSIVVPPHIPSPEIILTAIYGAHESRSVLKATARVSVQTPEGKISKNVALIAKTPSFLRVEALPVFGTPDFFLTVNNKILKVFLPREQRYYVGEATKQNLFSFFNIMLEAETIVPILFGTPPMGHKDNLTLKGTFEGDLYRIDILSEERRTQSIWVKPQGYEVLRFEVLNEDDTVMYSAAYDDFYPVGDSSFARKVTITIEEPKKINATIRYSNVRTDNDRNMDYFDLPVPIGIRPLFIQ
jgi:outer membrane lipoprotein-sorting protein